jgi:hypothetical protein
MHFSPEYGLIKKVMGPSESAPQYGQVSMFPQSNIFWAISVSPSVWRNDSRENCLIYMY